MPRTPVTVLPSDEELACRAQQGCAASLDQLLRRFQAPVLHFLRHRGALADAEDLAQETFVRACVHLHRYRPKWRFAPWLFTIARRLSINHHRRTRPVADEEALAGAECPWPGPDQLALDEERRHSLWRTAAEVLSEEQMTAVWLYYVEDMPAREIALVLDRSWVSVKTMLFRARKKLFPVLRAMEPEGLTEAPAARLQHTESAAVACPLTVEVPDG